MNNSLNRNPVPMWRLVFYAIFTAACVDGLVVLFHGPKIALVGAPAIAIGTIALVWFVGNTSMKPHPRLLKYASLIVVVCVLIEIFIFLFWR